jgi:hypothetical protein
VMARCKAAAEKVRGRHFPYHYKLEKLLKTFDPAIGPFEMEMFRRNARDLRKWLEGPYAIGDAPGVGLRIIELPGGWELRLGYFPRRGLRDLGKVLAVFRPPVREGGSQPEPSGSAAEPAIAAEGEPAEGTSALV